MKINISIPITILLLAGLVNIIAAKLQIQSPSTLRSYFDNKYNGKGIPYSIANFGDVPYGKSIIG
jgi:hypothetical protein